MPSPEASQHSQLEVMPSPKPPVKSNKSSSKQKAQISPERQGSRPVTRSSVVPTGGQGARPSGQSSSDADADDENEEDDADSEPIGVRRQQPPSPKPVDVGKSRRPRHQELRINTGTSRLEDFFWATLPAVTNSCIATLELLDAGKDVHESVEKEGIAMLTSRCQVLHKLYGNAEFLEFLNVAVESLARYEGKEKSYPRKFMVDTLRQFGFVISPRMWTKLELLMLMVIILEPELQYMGIRQKDRQNERDQNR